MKLVIVGGVAGGASAAARARRLDESSEIVLFERGKDPSFANCGMPYYIGGEIADRAKLLVAPVARLRDRYRLDVRTESQVEAIDRGAKTIRVRDLVSDRLYEESYDKLILATGAAPLRPPIPGIDGPGIHTLRDLRDADRFHALVTQGARSAIVVGAGFIGMEMAENLVRRGLSVTVVELADQILPPWDREMMTDLTRHLVAQGVQLHLNVSAQGFESTDDQVQVSLSNGTQIAASFVVLSIGVRPENGLAVAAGLAVGARGGIQVNQHMQTSDPDIYAVGDVVEVAEVVSGKPTQIPLAGPANRQGRIAADHLCGRPSVYRGTQGTAIVGLFGKTAAMTGLSEKTLLRMERAYEKVYIHPAHHAGYYPGAEPLTLKLLFDPNSGKILGAQGVGGAGVDKRIDVIATAIQANLTVFDLEEVELCYAPQYGSAKDPINMLGFVAAGVLRGDQPIVHVAQLAELQAQGSQLIDVRSAAEFARGHVPDARHMDVDQIRQRLSELDPQRPVVSYCQVGMRGYLATRILRQSGFDARNVSGGYTSYLQWIGSQ